MTDTKGGTLPAAIQRYVEAQSALKEAQSQLDASVQPLLTDILDAPIIMCGPAKREKIERIQDLINQLPPSYPATRRLYEAIILLDKHSDRRHIPAH